MGNFIERIGTTNDALSAFADLMARDEETRLSVRQNPTVALIRAVAPETGLSIMAQSRVVEAIVDEAVEGVGGDEGVARMLLDHLTPDQIAEFLVSKGDLPSTMVNIIPAEILLLAIAKDQRDLKREENKALQMLSLQAWIEKIEEHPDGAKIKRELRKQLKQGDKLSKLKPSDLDRARAMLIRRQKSKQGEVQQVEAELRLAATKAAEDIDL
jgi:hypothetical protein